MTLIGFPSLGLELSLNRVAFSIFGVPIYWYGIIIGVGILLAVLFAVRQAPRFGVDPDRFMDVGIIAVILGVIGARLYYVLFISDIEYHSLWEIVNTRDGGLGIYGGVILGFASGMIAARIRKIPVLAACDVTGMGFLIGHGIGRWGNFFNQEAFGVNTNLPWGMLSPTTTAFLQQRQASLAAEGIMVDPSLPVHPTFLYESLWCGLGLLLLFLYRKHRRFNGEMVLFYVMWYGAGRFFIEGLRTDSLMFLGFRISQLVAAITFFAALALWVMGRVRHRGGKGLGLIDMETIKAEKAEKAASKAKKKDAAKAADTADDGEMVTSAEEKSIEKHETEAAFVPEDEHGLDTRT